jgi:SAM-dependent methyltransferase
MATEGNKIDWAEKCWKEMLVYQRKSALHEMSRDRIADFYGLRPGMTVVDVGCGLGFMGSNYWKYFGKGGLYVGVDNSSDVLRSAYEGSSTWAVGGLASFISGDAYHLPVADDSADCVMCQTLLIHLADPRRALKEMIRVTKPGCEVICQEPDNLSPRLAKSYWSLPEESVEALLLKAKVALLCNQGRIKLGRGDKSIGPQVYVMMKQLGLIDVDVRTSDYVPHLHPPYDSEREKVQVEMVSKEHLDKNRYRTLREREKEEFLAGGGILDEWQRYCEYSDKLVAELRQQIDDKRYYYCGVYPFYFTKGLKPKG